MLPDLRCNIYPLTERCGWICSVDYFFRSFKFMGGWILPFAIEIFIACVRIHHSHRFRFINFRKMCLEWWKFDLKIHLLFRWWQRNLKTIQYVNAVEPCVSQSVPFDSWLWTENTNVEKLLENEHTKNMCVFDNLGFNWLINFNPHTHTHKTRRFSFSVHHSAVA